jgi:stage III sporulation protein AG
MVSTGKEGLTMISYTPQSSVPGPSAGKRSGKTAIAVGGILLGVILLVLGNTHLFSKGEESTPADRPGTGVVARTTEEYRADLETRMEAICARVTGVGAVDVIVTLEGGYEYVYATDKKTTVGGESTSYITVGSGDGESLVYITERLPAILGIGVVCAGGMDATVRREVTSLLSAAFGVGTNKIYVTGRSG